jgi:hypothetical protein
MGLNSCEVRLRKQKAAFQSNTKIQNKMTETKSFTIKGARLSDIEAFNKYKSLNGFTQGKVFEHLIEGKFTGTPPENTGSLSEEAIKKTEDLEKENTRLSGLVDAFTIEKEAFTTKINELTEQVNVLTSQLEIAPKEVIKEVPVKLAATQFIVSPTHEQAEQIRKARPFLRRDGVLKTNDYPGELVLTTVEKFLKSEYSELF